MAIPPAIMAILLVVIAGGFSVSSGVRAFVGGESLWSKNQKLGVAALYSYALSRDPGDYRAYEASSLVPDADRRGRLELQRNEPDMERAVAAFVEGGNHPRDARLMAWVFRVFADVSYFRRAIEIWTAGDEARDRLDAEARELRVLVTSGAPPGAVEGVLARIKEIDRELTGLEHDFSSTLAEGARWVHRVVLIVASSTGLVLAVLGVIMMGRFARGERRSRQVEQERNLERLAAERALRERDEQLRQAQKMEAVGQLAGGVAHDFNNLLMVIRGNLELALDTVGAADTAAAPLRDAERAADRATSLTAQLLAFSRRQVVQTQVLQLNDVVAETRSMLDRIIGENIRLDTDLGIDLPPIEGDPGQLAQVVLNLVVNARDALPEGGTVDIRTFSMADGPPTDALAPTTLTKPDQWIVLEVEDHGAGMDDATRQRIFEPFFSTKTASTSVGLGLATVYAIVSAMHGAIEVESALGEGARFRVWFRTTSAAPTPAAYEQPTARARPPIAGTAGTILVVEDEAAIRALINRVLEDAGYIVRLASNGLDALDQLVSGAHVDLVLSDVVMPVMGGRQLAREMRARGSTVPVLFMSGYTADSTPLSGSVPGHVGLLTKPFTARQLIAAVEEILTSAAVDDIRSARV